MDGEGCASLEALNSGYKQSFPRTWVLSTQLDQDGGRSVPGDNGGVHSATSLEPPSSDTLTPPSSIASSNTVHETVNGSAGVTAIRPHSNDNHTTPDRRTPSPNSATKSGLRAKFKSVFHKSSRSKNQETPMEVTSDSSLKLETEKPDLDGDEPTPKAPEPPVKQFRWPTATELVSESVPQSSESTPKLQYQPKQPSPQPSQNSPAAQNTAPFRPLPPDEFRAALAAKPTIAPSARGPPPAPSASANNRHPASVARSDTGNLSSAHPGSAISGHSVSTSSELADLPSRLPYQSPGYSPGYSR